MEFREFVTKRMDPFGGLKPPFGCQYDDMFPALRDALIDLSGEEPKVNQPSELAWIQTIPGKRVAAVCAEAADLDECPTTPALKAIWHRLYPPVARNIHRADCACSGTGWLIVESRGIEGAARCEGRTK